MRENEKWDIKYLIHNLGPTQIDWLVLTFRSLRAMLEVACGKWIVLWKRWKEFENLNRLEEIQLAHFGEVALAEVTLVEVALAEVVFVEIALVDISSKYLLYQIRD